MCDVVQFSFVCAHGFPEQSNWAIDKNRRRASTSLSGAAEINLRINYRVITVHPAVAMPHLAGRGARASKGASEFPRRLTGHNCDHLRRFSGDKGQWHFSCRDLLRSGHLRDDRPPRALFIVEFESVKYPRTCHRARSEIYKRIITEYKVANKWKNSCGSEWECSESEDVAAAMSAPAATESASTDTGGR
ncbi:hypothetical protein EVAR_41234_1 [Eumeta japonica]|uniref:Uncharacterized protein n=1 Tax=Eumeta variegata TaxID=151549 RepID=A0A4C1W4K6_EUMVA|nr:hypothetical protein EVAR_41234_1 [Eumeta japonica]